MVTASVAKTHGSCKGATKPVRERLIEALASLSDSSARLPHSPTISTLCRLADVSRNTLYRYYPEIADRARRLRLRRGHRRSTRESVVKALRSEIAALRAQLAQLATLADHYFAAAEEQRALVARRDRELAALKARSSPAPIRRGAFAGDP